MERLRRFMISSSLLEVFTGAGGSGRDKELLRTEVDGSGTLLGDGSEIMDDSVLTDFIFDFLLKIR